MQEPYDPDDLSIEETLGRLAQGQFFAKVERKLDTVIKLCEQYGTAGEVTIKLKVKRASPSSPMVVINESISMKEPPEPTLGGFVYWYGGVYSETDPTQPKLPEGRKVDGGQEARAVTERLHEVRKVGE